MPLRFLLLVVSEREWEKQTNSTSKMMTALSSQSDLYSSWRAVEATFYFLNSSGGWCRWGSDSWMLLWTFAFKKAFRCRRQNRGCICISFQKLTEAYCDIVLLVRCNHNVERICNGNIWNKICTCWSCLCCSIVDLFRTDSLWGGLTSFTETIFEELESDQKEKLHSLWIGEISSAEHANISSKWGNPSCRIGFTFVF